MHGVNQAPSGPVASQIRQLPLAAQIKRRLMDAFHGNTDVRKGKIVSLECKCLFQAAIRHSA